MSAVYHSYSEGEEHDNDDILQSKLADLEKEVKALRLRKNELEQLLQQPVEFKDVASEKRVARTVGSHKHFQNFESAFLQKKLTLHNLTGAVVVMKEGRNFIVKFSASARGCYCEPNYVHFRKLIRGPWTVVRYFLPDSVNLREMVKTSPLNNDGDIIHFIQSIQLCVEAYHDRKHQITLTKELAKSRGIKLFSSTDYMFVMFTIRETNRRSFPVTVSLIYESSGVRPTFLEVQSKGVDKRTVVSIEEEFEVLKMLSLNRGFDILFVKQDENTEDSLSEGSSNFLVLDESDPKGQGRPSIESSDSVDSENERDESDRSQIKGQRKGVGLRSREGINRQRNYVGSSSQRIANKSSRKNMGRDAGKNPRKGVASVSGITRRR